MTMPPVRSFRDLTVWQKGMQLLDACEDLADHLCSRRRHAAADQLLRAALSVPSNISEGHGRLSKADNVRHLAIARGSLFEVITILSSKSVRMISSPEVNAAEALTNEIGRMLTSLIRKLGTRKLQ